MRAIEGVYWYEGGTKVVSGWHEVVRGWLCGWYEGGKWVSAREQESKIKGMLVRGWY